MVGTENVFFLSIVIYEWLQTIKNFVDDVYKLYIASDCDIFVWT